MSTVLMSKNMLRRKGREADNRMQIQLSTSLMRITTLFQGNPNEKKISTCKGFDAIGCTSGSTMRWFILGLQRTLPFILLGVIAMKLASFLQAIDRVGGGDRGVVRLRGRVREGGQQGPVGVHPLRRRPSAAPLAPALLPARGSTASPVLLGGASCYWFLSRVARPLPRSVSR